LAVVMVSRSMIRQMPVPTLSAWSRRRRHQRDERIEGVGVLLGERLAARERGAPAGGDVGMLRHEQRLEAALLGGAGQLVGPDGIVGGEHADAQMHGIPPW
jgi:hypothetical protein